MQAKPTLQRWRSRSARLRFRACSSHDSGRISKCVPWRLGFASVLALVLMGSSTALACLNDSETPKYEEEFQKQYKPQTDPSEAIPWHLAGVGVGGSLMGCAAVCLVRTKRLD